MRASAIAARVAAVAVAVATALYGVEDFAARRRPLGSVEVHVYDVIPQKGNRVQFMPEEPQAEPCVQTVAPHLGQPPCWYLRRHAQRLVDY